MTRPVAPVPDALASPCTGVCTLDPVGDVCLGCGRTIDEIMQWSAMDAGTRSAVIATLPARIAAFHPANGA